MTDEVVTRLYRCLVDELRRRGHSPGEPVKVSQLYQELVPYRAVRSALGVELNADYEHALLRLLAGERELLRLKPEEAREELRREVGAPYPFVGIFRKFSASDVWVTLPPEPMTGSSEATRPGRAEDDPDIAPARRPPRVATPESGPGRRIAAGAEFPTIRSRRVGSLAAARPPVRLHHDPDDPATAVDHGDEAGGACAFCGENLPQGRRVRFCPHCGGDQRLIPCPRCEAVLERDWQYCISCGYEIPRD